MEKILRNTFVERLQNEWGGLVGRWQRLSAAGQQEYLVQQGYARLGDLLAHVIAWWQDGCAVIEVMRGDAQAPLGEYDVDSFNASAVEKYKAHSQEELIALYESQRQVMLKLVQSLPDSELYQENINQRLFYEIIQHWKEHTIS